MHEDASLIPTTAAERARCGPEVAQQGNAPPTEPSDLTLVPETHTVGRREWTPERSVLCPPPMLWHPGPKINVFFLFFKVRHSVFICNPAMNKWNRQAPEAHWPAGLAYPAPKDRGTVPEE